MKIFLVILVFSIQAMAVENSSIGANDGISSIISAEKLKGLEDWLYNLKLDIQRDTTQIEKAEVGDKEAMLYSALQRAFKSAGTGTEEFLTRNILIRGIEVYNEILSKDMGSDVEPKRSAFARRFLELHLRWAGELAPLDKQLLENLKDPYKISESEQRVEIGMEWAQKMVALSFSSPSNESHYNFLLKAMGYLFNDIVNDDRYNRKLGSTARVFVEKYQELKSKNKQRPLEFLEEAKDFREFLLDEFKVVNTIDWGIKIMLAQSKTAETPVVDTTVSGKMGSTFYSDYKVFLNYKCSNGSGYIGSESARQIAKFIVEGLMLRIAMKETYYTTCDFNESMIVAREAKKNLTFYNNYKSLLYYKCSNGSGYIGSESARSVAKLITEGTVNRIAMKETYYLTCDFNEALSVGKMAASQE